MVEKEGSSMIFNILIKEEDELFVAHCLELDIVATAKSLKEVGKDIIPLVCAQVDYAFINDNLENLYHPAPKEVWKQFFACKKRFEKRYRLEPSFKKDISQEVFVPPWIIANTCQMEKASHA